ncbi:hypothetical protein ACFLTX_00740 [Chloroflexota bacterium]
MKSKSFRNVIKLSSLIDGDLSTADSAKMVEYIKNDQESQDILDLLTQAKHILKNTPKHRSPRNFQLSPKMVGLKPPIPRSVPIFRMASAATALVLVISFAIMNVFPAVIGERMSADAYPAQFAGKGGGCGYDNPADCPPPMEAAPEYGIGGGEPILETPESAMALAPETDANNLASPNESPDGDTLRTMESPTENLEMKSSPPEPSKPFFSLNTVQWGLLLLTLTMISAGIFIRQIRIFTWRKRL